MKVVVNKDACIGCGACVAVAEDIFEINEEGLSEVKVDTVPEDKQASAQEAIDSCPTVAIAKADEKDN